MIQGSDRLAGDGQRRTSCRLSAAPGVLMPRGPVPRLGSVPRSMQQTGRNTTGLVLPPHGKACHMFPGIADVMRLSYRLADKSARSGRAAVFRLAALAGSARDSMATLRSRRSADRPSAASFFSGSRTGSPRQAGPYDNQPHITSIPRPMSMKSDTRVTSGHRCRGACRSSSPAPRLPTAKSALCQHRPQTMLRPGSLPSAPAWSSSPRRWTAGRPGPR